MGIDFHLSDYSVSFHIPRLPVVLVALMALAGAWKLSRLILAALSN